jgi:hypothetical protein
VTAAMIATALGGRKAGAGWMARCPAHHDQTPSLSICDADDGKVLIRCYAGCDQNQVIASLRSRGLWTENGPRRFNRLASRSVPKNTGPDRDDTKRTEAALAIWQATMSADGTLVETYLARDGGGTRTIKITTTQPCGTPEKPVKRPSLPSASSAPIAKSNPANGSAARPLRAAAYDADGNGNAPTVRANPLKTNAGTAADGADADLPRHSALENNGTLGWSTGL